MSRRNGDQGAAHPAASLPTMAITISAPATTRVARDFRGRRIEEAQVDRRADAHEEDGSHDGADRLDLALDGVELIGPGENDTRGEGADDEGGAGERRQGRETERERDREDDQDVADPHPDDERRTGAA